MAKSIYATFESEHDAERATGALIDHGVAAENISFVISGANLPNYSVAHEPSAVVHEVTAEVLVDAVPPPSVPIPGTYVSRPATNTMVGPDGKVTTILPPSPTAVIDSAPLWRNSAEQPVEARALPSNTPQEIVEHERRAHIIDMESERPHAADGISTTTAADAAVGAAGGAGIGVGLGILLGMAAVAVPGVGFAAGSAALVAGLAAATGVAGGIAGGIYGYLVDLGIPQQSARLISDHLLAGGVVLHVDVTGAVSEDDIMLTLTKYGATSAQGF